MRLITRDYGSEARQNERQLSRKYVCQVFSAFHATSEERMGEGWGGRPVLLFHCNAIGRHRPFCCRSHFKDQTKFRQRKKPTSNASLVKNSIN